MSSQIIITKAGAPEVLVDRPYAPPALGPEDVRIDVVAAGVNFADVVGRLGNYQDAPPMPYCPGYEVAGTIAAVGSAVTALQVGQRVCAFTRFGGYARIAVAPQRVVFALPDSVAFDIAAAVPVTYLTAQTCLFEAGNLRPGKRVLILGGAGGVGSAAIQLARQLDVIILATAGSAAKCDWMRGQGVHHAINYNETDVAKAVHAATGGRGVDIVLDPIGGRGIATSIAMCAPLGKVILYGASSMSTGKTRSLVALVREGLPMRFFNLVGLFNSNVGIHPINMLHLAEAQPELIDTMMRALLDGVAAGTLAPVVSDRFSLDAAGAQQAHHYLQDRKNIGKVVLVA